MMKSNAKWLCLATGVATAGAGAWVLTSVDEPGTQLNSAQGSEADETVRMPAGYAPPASGCSFKSGDSFAYTLSTVDRAELDLQGLAPSGSAAESQIELSTRARLELRAVETSTDGAVFVGRFAEIAADGVVQDERLQEPFLVRIDEACSLAGFAHVKGLDTGYARVQQALLHELSWAWPTEADRTFEGSNTNGRFVAAVSAIDGGESFEQTITEFEPWSRDFGAVERVEVASQKVVPGERAWFQSLESRAQYVGARSSVTHTASANYAGKDVRSLDDASTDESSYVWADLLPTLVPLDEQAPPTESELLALADARKLTVDQALDRYVARATDSNVGIQDTWPELRTFLEAKPQAANEVVDAMKRRKMPAEATMGAYIALGNARTPQAKAALEGVMRDENAPVIERSRAILALIDRDDVGVELASYLGEKSGGLANGESSGDRVLARQSLLALGAMSGRKPLDEDIKQRALREISQRLDETRDLGAAYRRPIYGALANIGDPASLAMVADIPDHPDADVREAAAIVFRRMPPAESADFAARWLAVETNPNVKRKLWHTIELQTFDARENTSRAVLEFAVRDLRERPGPITRKALIRLLARAKVEQSNEGGPNDDLGIEDLFVELMPWEFEQKSGFDKFMHDAIEFERREALYAEIARQLEGTDSSGESSPPAGPQIPGFGTGAGEKAR